MDYVGASIGAIRKKPGPPQRLERMGYQALKEKGLFLSKPPEL